MFRIRRLPKIHPVARAAIALAPALLLLALGATLSSATLAALSNTAAVIFLAVLVFEAVLRRDAGSPDQAAVETSYKPESRETDALVKVLAFVGTSTSTLASAAQSGNPAVLEGWLDVISGRLSKAIRRSAGAMIVREEFVVEDGELMPFCDVAFAGGAPQCTLPQGIRIPIRAGIGWDIAQYVGAREIFISSIDPGEQRYWLCLTFATEINHELLQPLCDAMIGPVTLMLTTLYGPYLAARGSRPPTPGSRLRGDLPTTQGTLPSDGSAPN
jgi:hypothetical protein